MKKQIFDFIKKKTSNIQEVINIKVKDYDDDNGFVGEHYIVKCIVNRINPSSPSGYLEGKEETCLVNIEEFRKIIKKEESIKWI